MRGIDLPSAQLFGVERAAWSVGLGQLREVREDDLAVERIGSQAGRGQLPHKVAAKALSRKQSVMLLRREHV